MSENIFPTSENMASDQESTTQMSGGAMLRKAREAEGLHIAALAVSLKVPVKKLEALESDQFDLLPDIVFVRALAASVCRTLKIDPVPILERLPRTTAPILKTDESGINTPFRTSGVGSGYLFLNQFTKPTVLAVLLLLIGVVVLVFFPIAQRIDVPSVLKSDNDVTQTLPIQAPRPDLMTFENTGVNAPAQSPGATSSNSASSLDVNQQSVTPAAALPVAASSASTLVVSGSGATSGMVILKAHKSSWVEVVDASGVVQLRKTLIDGEIVAASGAMPLSVVVGRADTTEVQVRGKPFDLTRVSKDNVARFEVK